MTDENVLTYVLLLAQCMQSYSNRSDRVRVVVNVPAFHPRVTTMFHNITPDGSRKLCS